MRQVEEVLDVAPERLLEHIPRLAHLLEILPRRGDNRNHNQNAQIEKLAQRRG